MSKANYPKVRMVGVHLPRSGLVHMPVAVAGKHPIDVRFVE